MFRLSHPGSSCTPAPSCSYARRFVSRAAPACKRATCSACQPLQPHRTLIALARRRSRLRSSLGHRKTPRRRAGYSTPGCQCLQNASSQSSLDARITWLLAPAMASVLLDPLMALTDTGEHVLPAVPLTRLGEPVTSYPAMLCVVSSALPLNLVQYFRFPFGLQP